MVLLHVLVQLSKRWQWRLQVAHFNHRLRGKASDVDEQFVRKTADRWDLPIVVGRGDVRLFARRNGLSIEMAARQLRHEFFAKAARKLIIPTLALGHHADDQVELFFLRLLRGAGADGLAGMNWQNPSPVYFAIQIVRPLLDLSKADLLAFAVASGIASREDSSNASSDFQRNRIRHELLPILEKIQPQYAKGILRTMEIVGKEGATIRDWADQWGKSKTRPVFDGLAVPIQRRILQAQLAAQGLSFDYDLIEFLRETPGSSIMVSPGCCLSRDAAGRIRLSAVDSNDFKKTMLTVRMKGTDGCVRFANRDIAWKILPPGKSTFGTGQEFFDADKVGEQIILRHWRPGDRFQPIGMKRSKKLQDCFMDLKIPRATRKGLLVATTAGGEIFWVEGLRISERFKLDNRTKRRLKWTFA